MDGTWPRETLLRHRDALLADDSLLAELGLRRHDPNVIDFGHTALARTGAAHAREAEARQRLEAIAKANYVAQSQTLAAALDLMEAGDGADLAERVDRMARIRLGLLAGCLALEGQAPTRWRNLAPGQMDLLLGPAAHVLLGVLPTAAGLFGGLAPVVGSVALIRLDLPGHAGLFALAAAEADGFSPELGADLIQFLADVAGRMARRWLT